MMGEETSASWHSMSEDNLFSDHKVTLLPIKVKVCFLATLEIFVRILEVFLLETEKSSMKPFMILSVWSEKVAILHL